MHDAVTPYASLLGTWEGEGHGEYPTITPFDYRDRWEFTEIGKPFVQFVERTWNAAGQPMHTESGYLRCVAPGVVELVASLPTGQAETGRGAVVGSPLRIDTDATVQNTDTAKQVNRIVRRFAVDGDRLTYRMDMAAVGQGLTLHLTATLHRC